MRRRLLVDRAIARASALAVVSLVILFAGMLTCNSEARPESNDNKLPRLQPRITVHPSQSQGTISPLIFGAAIEWTEDGNRIFDPSSGRVRPEIVEALKPIRIPVVRFPGGILADYYHWEDAIGPRQNRPRRKNPMDNTEQGNDFGTDEFISLCRQINAEPLVTANAGTGSLDELLGWQKYFSSHHFPVKYWEIGNEIYLAEPKEHASIAGNDKRIYKTVGQYGNLFNEWSSALRKQDKSVEVGAIAGTYNTSRQNKGWLDKLLSESASQLDFVALHDSFAPLIFSSYSYSEEKKRTDAYRAMFAAARFTSEDIQSVTNKLRKSGVQTPRIAITEHFPLFGAGSHEQLMESLDQSRTLGSALYTASLLHTYMREHVWMANYNLITSKWFGALLTDTNEGLVRTPTYHVWDLYRNHFGDELLRVDVNTNSFDSKPVGAIAAKWGIPYLDAVASRDSRGAIYLSVINRDLENAIPTIVNVDGIPSGDPVEVLTLNGPSEISINGPSLTRTTQGGPLNNVTTKATKWTSSDKPYPFPPHSITIMKWEQPRRQTRRK